jgi:tripartite-type tricarboxylate transporter receptor subunit TctC
MKIWLSSVLLALIDMARTIGRRAPQLVALSLMCWLSVGIATAQSFPAKPLRLIIRAPPGGTDDLLGRLVAQKMGEILGQQVIIDYRTGAGGLVAWEYVANAVPDGYTLLLAASGLGAIKSMRPEVTIDPWRDFTWISQVTNYQLVLLVHPALPAKTLKELIALARARPGQLSYGSSGRRRDAASRRRVFQSGGQGRYRPHPV